MSWTDRKSIEHIKKIRDLFKVDVFVETGSNMGINSEVHSKNFKVIFTCENNKKYYNKASKRLDKYKNIIISYSDSPYFLKKVFKLISFKDINNLPIIYLDAHFYDPKKPKGKGKFVVLNELRALKGRDCILVIHDFDNNLGHITYDGISLDMKLLKKDLLKINPNFKFYTNELSSCDIMKISETKDKEMIKNLKYTWSKPEKTYRGILYCLPKKVNIEGLREIK